MRGPSATTRTCARPIRILRRPRRGRATNLPARSTGSPVARAEWLFVSALRVKMQQLDGTGNFKFNRRAERSRTRANESREHLPRGRGIARNLRAKRIERRKLL